MVNQELYGLRIPVTLAMYSDVRELCSRYQEKGVRNVYALIDPSYRRLWLGSAVGWRCHSHFRSRISPRR